MKASNLSKNKQNKNKTMGASKISMKLLIDTNNNKVVFAEAGKNCVDFLFHLLSLPLGTAVRLLRKQQMMGSLENLYDSIENLDEAYIQPNQSKDIFLSPKSPAGTPAPAVTLLPLGEKNIGSKAFYTCSNSCSFSYTSSSSSTDGRSSPFNFRSTDPFSTGASGSPLFGCGFGAVASKASKYVSDDPRAVCPQCSRTMSLTMKYVAPPPPPTSGGAGSSGDINESGFLKGLVTYMIMDDLKVQPVSTVYSITLLNEFNVKNLGVLKGKTVDLGMNEALKLLKASLESKTVLTDVFLADEEK